MAGITPPSTSIYNTNVICYLCKLENGSWILDSGASDHMSFDVEALYDLRLLESPVSVSLPNGHKVQVTQCGKLRINDQLALNHVLVVHISSTTYCL